MQIRCTLSTLHYALLYALLYALIHIDTYMYWYALLYVLLYVLHISFLPFFLHSKFYSVLVPCLPPTTKHIKQPRYRSYHCVKEPIWTTIVSQGCSRDLLFRILWLLPWNCSWHIELKMHHRLVVRDNRILPNPAFWLANERCVWDRTDRASFKPLKLLKNFERKKSYLPAWSVGWDRGQICFYTDLQAGK